MNVAVKGALRLIDADPVLSDGLITLGRSISVYYCSPLGEVLRSMLAARRRYSCGLGLFVDQRRARCLEAVFESRLLPTIR
jgi:hypothetical protein